MTFSFKKKKKNIYNINNHNKLSKKRSYIK